MFLTIWRIVHCKKGHVVSYALLPQLYIRILLCLGLTIFSTAAHVLCLSLSILLTAMCSRRKNQNSANRTYNRNHAAVCHKRRYFGKTWTTKCLNSGEVQGRRDQHCVDLARRRPHSMGNAWNSASLESKRCRHEDNTGTYLEFCTFKPVQQGTKVWETIGTSGYFLEIEMFP